MAPRKVSKKRSATDSKVTQLKARTHAAEERARRAKEHAKEARKLFKQAKKTAKRAKEEHRDLVTKLKGLLGSEVNATVKSVKSQSGKKQATKRPAVAVSRKKHLKIVAPAAKAGNPARERTAVTHRKVAKPKPVPPKKRAAVRKRSASVVRAPQAVPKRLRLVASGPKPLRPEASPPAEPVTQPTEPSESGTVPDTESAE